MKKRKNAIPGAKKVENEMRTWMKHKGEFDYLDVKIDAMLVKAEEQGILTKSGTFDMRKKKKVQEFVKYYKKYHESFTKYQKRQREEWKRYNKEKSEEGADLVTFKDYKQLKAELNDAIRELFNHFASRSARDAFELYENLDPEERTAKLRQWMKENWNNADVIKEEFKQPIIKLDDAYGD